MNIIQEINRKIEALEKQKADIQSKCNHPVNESKWIKDEDEYGSEIGPGAYANQCLLCEAHWGSKEKPAT